MFAVKAAQNNETDDVEIATLKKRYISPEERKEIIEELKLVPKMIDHWWIKINIKKIPISRIKTTSYW